MWDFRFTTALALMARTWPYLLLRIAVSLAIVLAFILATGTGAGLGFGIGSLGGAEGRATGALFGGIAGFGLFGGLLYLGREYLLYMVKAGHVAVLVELMDKGQLPAGQGQIAFGHRKVAACFLEANVLFGIDQLVRGVIRAMTALVKGLFALVPGFDSLAGLLRAFLKVAVGFIDEVILAHMLRKGDDHPAPDGTPNPAPNPAPNPWASAEEALVLYGQNYQVMMKNAAFIALFVYGLVFLIALLMLAPAAALAYLLPGAWSAGGVVFALLFAWAVKIALLEPLALACLMQVFFQVTEGQTPDPAWRSRLDALSGQFRALGEKAARWDGAAGHPARP